MLDFTILTKNNVSNCDDVETLIKEQDEKRKVFGLEYGKEFLCHFFECGFFNDYKEITDIETAIQYLAIKDGVDFVQFSNGNLGFVAYYNGETNGFEIIG